MLPVWEFASKCRSHRTCPGAPQSSPPDSLSVPPSSVVAVIVVSPRVVVGVSSSVVALLPALVVLVVASVFEPGSSGGPQATSVQDSVSRDVRARCIASQSTAGRCSPRATSD